MNHLRNLTAALAAAALALIVLSGTAAHADTGALTSPPAGQSSPNNDPWEP